MSRLPLARALAAYGLAAALALAPPSAGLETLPADSSDAPEPSSRSEPVSTTPSVAGGTIAWVDAAGDVHLVASGSFVLVPLGETPGAGTGWTIRVREGSWELPRPVRGEVVFRDVVLDGQPCHVPPPPWIAPWDGSLELRAHALLPCRLRVVASEDRSPVPDATVRLVPPRTGLRLHPGELGGVEPLAVDASGSVEVAPTDPDAYAWIRAPGRAWTRLRLDHRVGGEVEVALRPGGSLVLRIPDWPPDRTAVARVRRRGEREVVAERPVAADGSARFENLPPWSFDASIEFGAAPDELVLGRLEVQIAAGAVAQHDVAVALEPDPAAELSGSVLLPDELSEHACELHVERLDAPPRRAGELLVLELGPRAERPWSAGPVSAGRYALRIDPFQLEVFVETRPGEPAVVVVDGRELRRVRLALRVAGPEPVADLGLEWRPAPAAGPALAPLDLQPTAAGLLEFWAPPGPLELRATSPALRQEPHTVDPEATEELVLEARPALELHFLRDGEPARVPRGFRMRAYRKGPGAGSAGWPLILDHERVAVRYDEPGLYRLEFRPLDGLRPLDPVEVEADGSPTTRVELELRNEEG